MRKQIAGPVKVSKGRKAYLHASLRSKMEFAFVEVFVGQKGCRPSPFVPAFKAKRLVDGKPVMSGGTTVRLTKSAPGRDKHIFEVEADETQLFYLFQEVDTLADRTAKGKIVKDGYRKQIGDACRRIYRRLFG